MLWCEVGWTWYDTGDMAQAETYYEIGEQVLQEAGIVAGSVWATPPQQSYVNWREGTTRMLIVRHEALKLFESHLTQQNNAIEHIFRST